ncbi:MAG: prenyltransferase/squalene oxidase repeat-containing protein [Planctomycetota bacterium]
MTLPILAWLSILLAITAASPREEPPTREEVARCIDGAARWLVANQRADGAWGSHRTQRVSEYLCSVPGSHDAYRIATTSLCIIALMDAPAETDGRDQAVEHGLDYLLAHYDVKRADLTEHYNVWSIAYGLQCFGERLFALPAGPRTTEIREASRHLVARARSCQALDGGWGYLSLEAVRTHPPSETSMTFVTAAMLVGLERVQRAGLELPPSMIEAALRSIERCLLPTGSYGYGQFVQTMPFLGVNQPAGAACRTPACQYARGLFGRDVPVEERRRGLRDMLTKHFRFQLCSLRRPEPHAPWYQISGNFVLYGRAYGAYVLEGLPAADQLPLASEFVRNLRYCREPDGSYWDCPIYDYGHAYGTAYALIALSRVNLTSPASGE